MENLIILHGALGSKSQFVELVGLLKRDFNVIAMDFEGHGSNRGQKSFNMETFSGNVIDLMASFNISRSNFFGYSMGGYVALYMAKHYPEKADKIVCLGTKLEWNPAIAERETRMLNIEKMEQKVPKFVEMLDKRHNDWKYVTRNTAQMMLDLGNGKGLLMDDYGEIEQEILLLRGDNDQMVTQEETGKVANFLPNGHMENMENTVHAIEKVNVEELAKYIKTYISGSNL